jgi:hypothetical protein
MLAMLMLFMLASLMLAMSPLMLFRNPMLAMLMLAPLMLIRPI